MNPPERLAFSTWLAASSVITSSGTSTPVSMFVLTFTPIGVPAATSLRRRSPVERCARPSSLATRPACVPLPEAGRTMITRMSPIAAPRLLAHEPLVVTRDHVGLHLAHGVERHAHHDQERRSAEVHVE